MNSRFRSRKASEARGARAKPFVLFVTFCLRLFSFSINRQDAKSAKMDRQILAACLNVDRRAKEEAKIQLRTSVFFVVNNHFISISTT